MERNITEITQTQETIQAGKVTVFEWDIEWNNIYKNLWKKFTRVMWKDWLVRTISLAEFRAELKKSWQSKFHKEMFPLSWTDTKIIKYFLNRNNTKWHWLTNGWPEERIRKKLVISPEAPSHEQ